MASPLLDVREFDRWMANQVHEFQRPRVGKLTNDELDVLEERYGPLANRIAQIAEIELWEQNHDVRELAANSYGFAIQHKARDRLLKLIGAEDLRGRAADAAHASSDAELLARLDGLRAIGEASDA